MERGTILNRGAKVLDYARKVMIWQRLPKIRLKTPLFMLTGDMDDCSLSDRVFANLKIAKDHGLKYTVFLTPTPVERLHETVSVLHEFSAVVESHSFHVDHSKLRFNDQKKNFVESKELIERCGHSVWGLRLPWLKWNRDTLKAAEPVYKFDSSVVIDQPSLARYRRMILVPITPPTDTYFIRRHFDSDTALQKWKERAEQVLSLNGVFTVLAHPANPMADVLDKLISYVGSLGYRFTSPRELVEGIAVED